MEPKETRLQGADLIFLSEFPLGVLSDRPSEVNSVSFELRASGARKAKRWIIDAGARFGLPNYVDMQLFIICLAYTQEQGFPEQVHFCRNRLVQDLNWAHTQSAYERVQLSLDRFVATTYTAINHYPDPKGRDCVRRVAFHLMEKYEIHDSRFADAELPPSWFRWSDDVRRLLQTRQLKTLDLGVFRTLKRPVSQAMYRYLHTRHLDGKPAFEENLIEYACERLGLSRDFRWASDLKRTLNEGHKELIEKGLIARATYERMRTERGERPQQKVVIHYSTPAPASPPLVAAAPPAARSAVPVEDPLVARLVEIGVTRAVALALLVEKRDVVVAQLQWWPYREKIENPGGALRRAIDENWAAPEGWKQAQAKQRKRARAQERRVQEQAQVQAAAEADTAFEAWWTALPEAQRQTLRAQAEAELIGANALVRRHYERHPERLAAALQPLLRRLGGGDGG